jgi:benzoate-CoA ligase family protein
LASQHNLSVRLLDRVVDSGGGDREAGRSGPRRWTYRELLELVGRVGNGLLGQRVGPGDRVLLLLPDSVEFVAAFLGAIRIGAVAVPCNPLLRRADFELFLRESSAKVVVADVATFAELGPALREVPAARAILSVGGDAPGSVEWEAWLREQAAACPAWESSADDPAFWLWTSGSTGHPRAAVHRHRDWEPCVDGYGRGVLGIGPTDVFFSAAKSFHAYGLGDGTVFPLAVGARTVYLRGRPTPEAIYAILAEERPTLFFAVPTMYAALLSFADHHRVPPLPSLRHCVSAGEPLPGDLYRRWKERFGVEVLDGIGSTEVLHVYLSARAGKVRAGSVGTPVPGYSVRLVDETDADVPPGTLGDLWVRAPSLAAGYAQGNGLAPLRGRDGWFVSGDKFYADREGYYWYVGRADDMFKSRAEWVSPIRVEAALIEHPSVLESAVVGRVDEQGLTSPRAFVVLQPGVTASDTLAHELTGWLRARLSGPSVPRGIEFLPELPKSSTGKLLRYQLRGR